MNEKIIRPGVIKRIVDLTKSRSQKYTQEDVDNIITAFWDVIIEAIINGDSINLNGYVSIENKYMSSRKARNVAENVEMIVPEHYRVNFKAGSKLNKAAVVYTKKKLRIKKEEGENSID